MLQVCIFGGYEGALPANKRVFLTLFGGCTLHRPTLARQLLTSSKTKQTEIGKHTHVAITLFAGTEIKAPTLAEEFIDLQEAIRNGVLTPDVVDQVSAGLLADSNENLFSLTLFGSFEDTTLPTENEEIDGLALQRHLGNISDDAAQILQKAVGQGGAPRRLMVKQAVAADSGHHAVA